MFSTGAVTDLPSRREGDMRPIATIGLLLCFASVASLGHADTNPPINLVPTDGAEDVSLMPALSWTWEAPVGCPEGIGITVFTVFPAPTQRT
jgi:hypothetical protein